MSKKGRQAVTLIILCVLMVAAICLYVFVPKGKDESEDEETAKTTNVVNIEKDQVVSIRLNGKEREELTLTRENDAWKLADLPEAPVNSDAVDSMLGAISPVVAVKELELDSSRLSEYGLDEPPMTVVLTTSDGQEYEFKLGQTVPVTGGNYGTYSGGDKLYAFQDTFYNAFDVKENSLIEKEEIEEINGDYLTTISVKNKGEETFRAEVVPDEKKVDAYTNWVITKPYAKPLAGSSTEDWKTLQGYFTSVTLGELIEYKCKDFKKYGLDQPISEVNVKYFNVKDGYEEPQETASPDGASDTSTVNKNTNKANEIPDKYKDNKGYRLFFGKKTDDGDYYVRPDGSDSVYTMSGESAENMLLADAYTYMDHCVYSTLATDLEGYDVTIGDKRISVTHSTEKADAEDASDGESETKKDKNVWTLNGTRVPDEKEEDFLRPYSKQYLLEFTSFAKKSVKKKTEKPVMTIVFHEKGRDVTVKYLPYDGTNFYQVDKNGMDYFLVDKRSVDDMVSAFESLLELDLSDKK